ncbi:EF-hand calcium-binding domain-containing protein 14 isoform X2 [Lampris incognitus]|uniref:EF-hand calcium-binding domain-containing protein 14 isoform X2 n=1 Tax=Lampris incognitus TaxID=2546036 RepID=UPI0024B48346|nr:EF-hand calcium-binding domain-containing protein 14 isoform X2 [Lampris incognitus]
MKKRKELNALIGLGDSKRKKAKKGSGHRLLRTEPPDSESESSSDDDEFSNMSSVATFGKSYTQCCNVCYPLFLFIILAACVMACAGLIWMQIALKEDLDSLKEKLHTMESSQKVLSHEIPKLSEDLKTKQRKVDDIESGDKGLSKLWSNLTEMNRKISLLDSAVNHLKANIKSASDLINLPTTVEELQKSVATIGSTLTSVQHDVKTMQAALESQKKDSDNLKTTMELTDLRVAVSEANKTQEMHHAWTNDQIHSLLSSFSNLSERVSSLEHHSDQAAKRRGSEGATDQQSSNRNPATDPVKDVLTAEPPAHVGAYGDLTPLADPQPTRRPRFLSPKRSKRFSGTGCPKTVSIPGVGCLKDLEDVFQQAGLGRHSRGMSYQDLRKQFGSAISEANIMNCFDKDGDQRYSLWELQAAAGL